MKKVRYGITEATKLNEWQSTDSCWLLKDLKETIVLGETLNETIPNLELLLLEGPLGAGKTSFVKGMAEALEINEPITSPTFPLAQHYLSGKIPLIHLDLYRLEDYKAANELFFQEEEEANSSGALIAIEWPERLNLALPEAWKITMEYRNCEERLVHVSPPELPDMQATTS